MEWIADTLRHNPELAIFLTLGLGYSLGKLRLGKVSLGAVTGTLIAGLLIGQLGIAISSDVKSIFFLMFLFAVGYGAGPQFINGLKRDGISQVLFAVVQCLACLAATYAAARILGFDVGSAAGLLAGACTISPVIGVAADAINQLGLPAADKVALIHNIPVAYAVTYIFGTAGTAWFLATVGPRLLRVNLPAECRKLESQLGAAPAEPGVVPAYTRFSARAYRVANPRWVGGTVGQLEAALADRRVYVKRVRHGEEILEPVPETPVREGDVLALVSRRETLIEMETLVGPEADDGALLDFPAEVLDVVVTQKDVIGKTLQELAEEDLGQRGRGTFLRKLQRGGTELPVSLNLKVNRGDVLSLAGPKDDVERSARLLGYADRLTDKTDMVFVGIGILLGGLLGAVAVRVGGIPLSLSTSGGALVMGLVFGWLRSVHPTFGRVPAAALWVMDNVGCTTFIAAVGLTSAPSFIGGLKELGLPLFFAGIFVTLFPFLVSLFVGKYVFKMHPGVLLGACVGARTAASLPSVQDAADSRVPALGYSVTYAVGNILLIIWGMLIVVMLA